MNNNLCLKWNNHSGAFLQGLGKILVKEQFCDATIVCQGNFFPVHRFVLSTCSEYFEELFEKMQCQHPYIVFKDIKMEEMELLLNYMYRGEVNVIQENLPTLIKGAETLRLKGLAVPDDIPSGKESSCRKRKISHSSCQSRLEDRKTATNASTSSPGADYNGNKENTYNDNTSSAAESRLKPLMEECENIERPRIKEELLDPTEFENASGYVIPMIPSPDSGTQRCQSSDMPFSVPESGRAYDDETSLLRLSSSTNVKMEAWQDVSGDSWPLNASHNAMAPSEASNELTSNSKETVTSTDPVNSLREAVSDERSLPKSIPTTSKEGHKCPHCSYTHPSEAHVKQHFIQRHLEDPRPFKCGVCVKRFKQKHHLKTHWRMHSLEKPFQCPKCFKFFKHKVSLKYHTQKSNLCVRK